MSDETPDAPTSALKVAMWCSRLGREIEASIEKLKQLKADVTLMQRSAEKLIKKQKDPAS